MSAFPDAVSPLMPHASRPTCHASRIRLVRIALVPLLGFLAGCGSPSEEKLDPCPRHTISVGTKALHLEVALDPAHRSRGLMFRKELKPDEGMLFAYPAEDTLSFWMKNTYAPLSIAFIRADGWIIQIEDMEPQDLVTHQSRMKARYALEMPKGWFARNGVKEGDVVKIPEAVASAALPD